MAATSSGGKNIRRAPIHEAGAKIFFSSTRAYYRVESHSEQEKYI